MFTFKQIKDGVIRFTDVIDDMPDNGTILDTLAKCYSVLHSHDNVVASVSGGSDSDIMLDLIIRCGGKEKTKFVFFNTGLEYDATKRQINHLNEKYGIAIDIIPPVRSIPNCVKEFGVPFWSKHVSEMMSRLQRHGFKWEDEQFEILNEKYPGCQSALNWWCNRNGVDGRPSPYNINRVRGLKEFIIQNPPTFMISNKCCYYAKKLPVKKYKEEIQCDLNCVGLRRAEGGVRQTRYSSCFTSSPSMEPDEFRPIFWLTDKDKQDYESYYGISHSDCYEVWGMKRTGCAGCPYAQNFEEELTLAQKYEPKFYKAMVAIFGESYEYTRKFMEFRNTLSKE